MGKNKDHEKFKLLVQGTPLGYISKDQIVRNSKGEKLYFIDDKVNVRKQQQKCAPVLNTL
ncbi:hypothetical protein BEL04_04545 [Mucilaginibacter sp. PPCGB 2223]|nr:hypothetical protein BEL04_04545 [Mucilaginibacter sp. PPCGB 2223]